MQRMQKRVFKREWFRLKESPPQQVAMAAGAKCGLLLGRSIAGAATADATKIILVTNVAKRRRQVAGTVAIMRRLLRFRCRALRHCEIWV